jgi:hypothetical protein
MLIEEEAPDEINVDREFGRGASLVRLASRT